MFVCSFWSLLSLLFSHFSHVQLFATPWTAARQASPAYHHLPEFTQTHVPEVGDAIQPSHPLLSLLLLPCVFPSIRVFSSELALHTGGKSYWSFILASDLPMNIQDRFPLGWTGWISLQPKEPSRVFSNTTVQKHQFFRAQPFYGPTLTSIRDCWKAIVLTIQTFVVKVMSLLCSILSRLVIASLSFDYTDLCCQSDVSAL